jgi:hypothetical protein
VRGLAVDDDDLTRECGKPLVCYLCDSCAEHYLTDADPDACWEAHEAWRLGKGDPTFGAGSTVTSPRRGTVPAAPRPRWRS